jgi:CRISPR system Cascade subunit CasA
LSEHDQKALGLVQSEVSKWIESAERVAFLLRSAVQAAWFAESGKKAKKWFQETSKTNKCEEKWLFVDTVFWSKTEPLFYNSLKGLLEHTDNEDSEADLVARREAWRKELVDAAVKLFDAEFVGAVPIQRQNPRRIAEAHNRLIASLHGKKLKTILNLPIEKQAKAPKKAAGALT